MPKPTKHVVVREPAELSGLRHSVFGAAEKTIAKLRDSIDGDDPLASFARIKFDQLGFDPLDHSRGLNFVEQLNQTFTYLVTLHAARHLFAAHPTEAPFELSLGTLGGHDVRSMTGAVVAETFAAVDPRNNSKLDSDIDRMARAQAAAKYVFFCSDLPRYDEWDQRGVRIVPVSREALLAPW